MDAPVAIPHARLANLLDPSFQRGLPGTAGLGMVGRGVELEDLAGPSDRYAPIHQHPFDQLALADRPQSFSADDVLEHLPVQRQDRDNLFQTAILVFQGLQPTHLVGQQTGVLLAPIEIGRLADPCLPANLRYWHAVVALFKKGTPFGRPKKNKMLSSLPLLFPAGNLARKTPIKNGQVFEDQSRTAKVAIQCGKYKAILHI